MANTALCKNPAFIGVASYGALENVPHLDFQVPTVYNFWGPLLLLLGGELLAERCRTDDLMPSIPFLCLPPSCVDPKVLGLNVFVYHS